MPESDESEAFESAVSRLPYPVFVVDGESRLRAMNEHARQLWRDERLSESLLRYAPTHPISRVVQQLRRANDDDSELPQVELTGGRRYEVIHSSRSPKGDHRWLMLMFRPFPTAANLDRDSLRRRWSLTPREAEVAAACITGLNTAEIASSLAVSRETVKTHVGRVLNKAGAQNRSQLVAKYLFGG